MLAWQERSEEMPNLINSSNQFDTKTIRANISLICVRPAITRSLGAILIPKNRTKGGHYTEKQKASDAAARLHLLPLLA